MSPSSARPSARRSASLRARVVSLAAAGALAAGLLTVPMAQSASAASTSDKFESAILKSTNAQRAKRHKAKLKANACLDKFAEKQARRIAKRQHLYHQNLGKILKTCKLGGVGENVADGYPTAGKTVNAWMHSTGHRENILRTPYRYLGVGAVKDKKGRWWVAQVFGNKM